MGYILRAEIDRRSQLDPYLSLHTQFLFQSCKLFLHFDHAQPIVAADKLLRGLLHYNLLLLRRLGALVFFGFEQADSDLFLELIIPVVELLRLCVVDRGEGAKLPLYERLIVSFEFNEGE